MCQLEQGWWELADRKSLWQQVLRIWCLPKTTCQDRMIEDGGKKDKNTLLAWYYSLPVKVVLQTHVWRKFSCSSWLEQSLSPGKCLNSGHLTNPSQLSCHVRFVSPLTVSLCPDQALTICSTTLISLLPKMRAFVGIYPEIPQAHTRPLHKERCCIGKPLTIRNMDAGRRIADAGVRERKLKIEWICLTHLCL